MAIKLADTARPNNYVDAEHLGTFPVAYAEDVWFADGTRLSEKTFDGQSIQKEELPLASADELGNIYQYTGENGTYQHGCFYECVENSGAYSWQLLDIAGSVVYNVKTPPKLFGDEIPYDDGTVFVFSGEDAHGFLKGHHYRYTENFTINTAKLVRFWRNSEHTYSTYGRMAEDDIKVGTMLYTKIDGSDAYQCQLSIIAIDGDTITLWGEYSGNEIVCEYGYTIDPTIETINVVSGYIDIGGGGSGGNDYEEFVGTQAEWDALSQSQKDKYDGKIVNIIDDAEGENIDYYSTNEVKTNKVWIDGKPIYRKVFTDVSFPEEEDIVQADRRAIKRYTDAFPANYISNIVSASFVAINRTYGNEYSLPRTWESSEPDTGESMIVSINASIISESEAFGYSLEIGSNRTSWNNTNYKVRAIIEYTKTTD